MHSRYPPAISALPTTTPFAALDPFESCAITITRQVQVLIHYYWQILATGWLVDRTEVLPAHLRPVRRYENVRDQSMAGLLQDQVRVTALLAVMASRMVHLSKITIPQVNPEQFMLTALHTLREHMSKQDDDGSDTKLTVMYAVHSLALAEVYRKRYDDATVHLAQLKTLVDSTKIVSATHSYVAEAMINIDGLISIETGRIPMLTYSFDPGPLAEHRVREIECQLSMLRTAPAVIRPVEDDNNRPSPMIYDGTDFLADATTAMDLRMGEGFAAALQHGGTIHPAIAPLLQDILHVVLVAKIVWLTAKARQSDARWMCQRARVLNHRLLSLKEHLQNIDDPWIQRTEALRISLLLVLIRCTSRVAPRAAQSNVRLLLQVFKGHDMDWSSDWSSGAKLDSSVGSPPHGSLLGLQHDYPASEHQQNRLLLFILLTGHYNAMMAADPSQVWFLGQAADLASRRLGFQHYRELDDLMRLYMCNPVQQAVSLRLVAMHLRAMRQS